MWILSRVLAYSTIMHFREWCNGCGTRLRWLLVLALVAGLSSPTRADDGVLGGLTWMPYPSNWNAMAPKVVYDGLFTYGVLTGFGESHIWSVVRRRGLSTSWEQGAPTFYSQQPPVVYIDLKGRLNVMCNTPKLRHVRFPHPQVDLQEYVDIPTNFAPDVGYMGASYDPVSDTAVLAFSEVPSFVLHFSAKYTDANDWTTPTALPAAQPGNVFLYPRPICVGGRYVVLAGEHPVGPVNGAYVGATLFESPSPFGPWSARVIHQSVGANLGVPYSNWCYPLDMQVNPAGKLRITLHIGEAGSGHTPVPEGMLVAREEDGFALRHIAGHIDDGFPLHIDPSGVSLAFALLTGDAPRLPGKLVYYKSVDDCLTWTGPFLAPQGINPTLVDRRSGSLPMGKNLGFIYCANTTAPFSDYYFAEVPLGISDTPDRYDRWTTGTDGAQDYARQINDQSSGRFTFFTIDNTASGSFDLTYSYTAGSYYQVYTAKSNGSYSYYNSDGYTKKYDAPEDYSYSIPGAGGAIEYIHVYRDPANSITWWTVMNYDSAGNWVYSYVYWKGAYWYQEIKRSNGTFLKSDANGYLSSS